MAAPQSYITDKGIDAINALVLTGRTLKVTGAYLGNGVVSGEDQARKLTDLVNRVVEAKVVGATIKDSWHVISIRISNTDMAQEMTVHEIGLFCVDPDDASKEIMFYYATFGENPDWIAPNTISHYTRTYDLCMNVGLIDSVNVTISPDALVTEAELENAFSPAFLLERISSVDGSGSGLDADMVDGKHAADFAAKDHTHTISSDAFSGTLPVNKGGTGATTAAQARTNLGVTPANIGAATANHGHALTDLSGTLSIAKGGTGATTAAQARTNLGVTPANIGAAASSHSHALTDLSGTLSVAKGGTGATTAAQARTNLGVTPANIGAAASGHGHTLTDLSGTLSIAKGGTGATTAAQALQKLGIQYSATTPAVVEGGIWLKPI